MYDRIRAYPIDNPLNLSPATDPPAEWWGDEPPEEPMSEKAIETLTHIVIREMNLRSNGPVKPGLKGFEKKTVRETIRLLAEWYELDDSRPAALTTGDM